MSTNFTDGWFPEGQDPAAYDPIRAARGAMKPGLPRRFYQNVSTCEIEGRFAVLLDGRPARTRGRALLAGPVPEVAALLAAEWAAQEQVINPGFMPATRILHAALDHVAGTMEAVRQDILKYAGSDLVCYRAADPAALVERQAKLWDPVLDHARETYGARFLLTEGVSFVEQPQASIAALAPRLARITDPIALSALHVLTSVAGSALIALAVADGVLEADAGFDAGECDADYEVSVWGGDEEAAERRAARLADFRAAASLCRMIGP